MSSTDKLQAAISSALEQAAERKATETPTSKTDAIDYGARFDGLINALSGIGTNHSRVAHNSWKTGGGFIPSQVLTDMYRHDDMVRRLCSFRPKESTRQGLDTGSDQLNDTAKTLDVIAAFQEAMIWENLYGGSVIVMGINDGNATAEPLTSLKSIDWLKVIDKRWLQPTEEKIKDRKSLDYGKPAGYIVNADAENNQVIYHRDRLIIFPGQLTPIDVRDQNNGWGDSIVEFAIQVILDFAQAFASTSVMLSEANQAVFGIKGLIEQLAESDHTTIIKRMQLMNLMRSVARALILDADNEEFTNNELSFSGIAPVLESMMLRLSAAVEIPVSILMGRSPAGLNATGESDFRAFYDTIKTYQTNTLEPKLDRLFNLLLIAGVGKEADYKIKFSPLWQQTPKERAEERYLIAQADNIYLMHGVVLPEELALSRFREEGFNVEVEIDRAAREEAMSSSGETAQVTKSLITPTDVAKIVTVNEARAAEGLPPMPGPEGKLTVGEFFALAAARETEQQQQQQPEPPQPPQQPPQQPPPDDQQQ